MSPIHLSVTSLLIVPLLAALGPVVLAQAPVEDARQRQDAVLQGQQKVGAAYRDLQRAEYEHKQAELDSQRADTEYKAAQKRADELKREVDAAKKNLEAAKAKETQGRKSYDAAVNAVDQMVQKKPPPK